MAKRKIIKIDENKCTGCGLCIPNCPEGAIQIIDNKARLVSDLFCDGLGACIGHCPEGAIQIEEREAARYDERTVMQNIVRQGKNVIIAHLKHLKEHNQIDLLQQAMDFLKERKIEVSLEKGQSINQVGCPVSFGDKAKLDNNSGGCPGSRIVDSRNRQVLDSKDRKTGNSASELRTWPIQLHLVPPFASYLGQADLLIAADCVPFAYADFHRDLLSGKVLLVGCPKLDDLEAYRQKIAQIIEQNEISSITYAHMEVPCCFGLINVIRDAIAQSGRDIPFKEVNISIKGERIL